MRSWKPFAIIAGGLALVALALLLINSSPTELAGIAQTRALEDTQVTLRLDQQALGERVIEVSAHDANNRPLALRAVSLRFWMRDMNMGIIEVEAQPRGQGRFQARGSFFSMAGNWVIDTTLVREGAPSLRTAFEFPISAPGEQAGPSNPLEANPQTIAAGQRLYLDNCAACHGQNGRGDGPSAAALNPRPVNFSEHMQPGLHTDGQIFLWIKDGYRPGSPMPAWGGRLSETQIWQLITYLRTFGQASSVAQNPPGAYPAPGTPPVAIPEDLPLEGDPGAATPLPSGPLPQLIPTINAPLPPLAFTRNGNIWRSDGRGNSQPLTSFTSESYAQYPAFSPDGQQIAFITMMQPPITATVPLPTARLHVMQADGSNQRVLWQPTAGMLGAPRWAHDGTALYVPANGLPAAGASDAAGVVVFRLELASGTRQVVLNNALDPEPSPDGSLLAFVRLGVDGYSQTLDVATADGSSTRTLIKLPSFQGFYAPRFSPDGKQIVVAAIGGPETDAQGQPIESRDSPWRRLGALFAPPVASAHGLPWDLWAINTDGSGLRRLTQFYEDLPMTAFAPDGKQIAILGASGLYLMNPDGSNIRRIDPAGDHGGLDWAP